MTLLPQSYTNYKSIIIAKLQGIKIEVDSEEVSIFAEVIGYNKTGVAGYPVVYVTERTGSGELLDTHRNEREWQFDVQIHQEVGAKTDEQAYDALLDAVDRVIQSFDEDPMLKDTNGQARCRWVRVVPVGFEYASQETKIHRANLTIAIVNQVNRFISA